MALVIRLAEESSCTVNALENTAEPLSTIPFIGSRRWRLTRCWELKVSEKDDITETM